MSKEDTTTSQEGGETSTGASGQEGASTETDSVSKSEFDELKRQFEGINNANARLKSKVKSYEDKARETEQAAAAKAEKEGDHEKTIGFLKSQVAELEESKSSLNAKLENAVVDTELMSTIVAIGCKKPEAFMQLYRPMFELGESDEGRLVTKLKGTMAGVFKPAEFLRKELQEKYPEWMENQRAQGTGPGEKPEEKNGGGLPTLEQLNGMSRDDRRKALAGNKELRQQMYKGG
jgi:hypothetical protein